MEPLYKVRPLSDRSGFPGPARSGDRHPFTASWPQTEALLRDELRHLSARNVVLELDVRERAIRIDGTLRADAKIETTSGVRVAFQTDDGPVQFATDKFGWDQSNPPRFYAQGWQQNVRAIALGLSDLRRVDRYGISPSGQQYRGFLAIESGLTPTGMSADIALQVIDTEAGDDTPQGASLAVCAKVAKANAHPDRNNGDRSRWNAVEEAIKALTKAGRL